MANLRAQSPVFALVFDELIFLDVVLVHAMSSSDQRSLNERRASFRCPVNGPRRGGRLRIGKREIPVDVLDESAGGYSVVSEQELDCEVGQSMLLQIESSWTIVRIMNVQKGEANTRLGLLRLKDLEASEVEPEPRIELLLESLKRLARALAPLGRPAAGIVALLVGGALLGVGVIVVLERSAPLADLIEHDDASRKIEDMTLPDPPPFREGRTSEEEPEHKPRKKRAANPPTPSDPREETPAAPERPRDEVASEKPVPEHVIRHSHPGLLLKPEIVKLLDLTREQIAELRRLFEETRTSTAALLTTDSEATSSQHEFALELGRRSLAVLTPAQRETVTRMLSGANFAEASSADPGAASSPPAK